MTTELFNPVYFFESSPTSSSDLLDSSTSSSSYLSTNQSLMKSLSISTRPEIRKGCVWEIHLQFSNEIREKLQLKSVYREKPRGKTNHPYFCLKVRSKLLKPIKELAFTKVASIVNERDPIDINDQGVLTLKVKFTARPRAVFHKHSDMMILLACVKQGEETICQDEYELIFRGGTGSIHSSDSRKMQLKHDIVEEPKHSISSTSITASSSFESFNDQRRELLKHFHDHSNNVSFQLYEQPQTISDNSQNEAFQHGSSIFGGDVEFEEFNTDEFCEDFLLNKGDSLINENNIDRFLNPFSEDPSPTAWLSQSSSRFPPETIVKADPHPRPVMVRPAAAPPISTQKRLRSEVDGFELEPPKVRKEPRYLLEAKYYQTLFLDCLHYMTLEEIAAVCFHAPVPIFVKDKDSTYLFINPTFCSFILGFVQTEQVLNHTTVQLLDQSDADDIIKHDRYIQTQEEGVVKTFDVSIRKETYKVMKQWTTLRDHRKVILGIVISAL